MAQAQLQTQHHLQPRRHRSAQAEARAFRRRIVWSELWMLATATILLGTGALLLLLWDPPALGIAIAVGLLAVAARQAYVHVRAKERDVARASDAAATTGLVIAGVALAPLIAFALLWTGLLMLLGVMWLLHALGIT